MIFLRILKRIVSTFFTSSMKMEDYFYFWLITTPVLILGWFFWGLTTHNTKINSCYLETAGTSIFIKGARDFWPDDKMVEVHSNQEAVELMEKIPVCHK